MFRIFMKIVSHRVFSTTKRFHALSLLFAIGPKTRTVPGEREREMRAAQDWDTVSKSMEGVLEQEAKERARNRDAIASLRR